ncbi:YgfZ/GcvT domain-containing protein [Legionella maioricensis]|uniref:Folate-binding protein YgfZ n=1 Tax=Legionella maioricensis TaxID=2896528 RepID=A0A9X2D343_9GAMM|nr:folate-binding protein YgfZ [Legionella maioricensis]MCL9685573.1 folate-binding protein YgfZ [Legionella maioricensis]MCL9688924.1 folate-binding protein YgfZ [Legionella maioricensis]
MKNTIDHLINSRVLTTFNSLDTELTLNKKNNYLFDLSYLGLLNVVGDKAADFLQGQLTCDLRLVSDIQMIEGAQCNLKGRILSLLDIINWNGFKLILPRDLIESTQTSLTKTAQLSRVSIEQNGNLKVFGFYLQNPDDIIPEATFLPNNLYAQARSSNYCYYHLGNGFYIFIIQTDIEHEFCNIFSERNQLLGSLTWHTLRLYNHQIDIYPESRGLFLPHRLGLHQTQYISFDKGCYKGQEIIARTHYRATLKHELRLYVIKSEQNLYSGQKLLKLEDETELGELIDYSLLGNNHYLIAVSILKEGAQSARFEGRNEVISLESPDLL